MADQKKPALGKVLVVGGNGFLGHHIVRKLHEEWTATVVSVDVKCQRNRIDGTEYHEADITDAEELTALFDMIRPDLVIHTASPTAAGDDAVAHELFKKVNITGTANVVEACQKAGVKGLVFTSSASVVSDNKGTELRNADERWPVLWGDQQGDYYAETKAEAEEIVLKANRQDPYKLLTCSIRPAGIFGEGDVQLLKGVLDILKTNKTHWQVGDNTNIFDFTYVGNVAHGHLLAARALLAAAASIIDPLENEQVDGEAFFITNDEPIYFWDFTRAVWRHAGFDKGTSHVWTLPSGLGYVLGFWMEVVCHIIGKTPVLTRKRITYSSMTRYYNIGKAKQVLRYRPQVKLEDGIKRGVSWFLANEHKAAAK